MVIWNYMNTVAAGLELLTTGGGRGISADWGFKIGMGRSGAEGG